MGVYLSQPYTEKSIKEGTGNGLIYCKAEMQGILWVNQVGEGPWKTLLSMN